MIRIFGNEIQEGKFPPSISYTKGKLIVGQIFPYLTRRWRAVCAEKYMIPAERHLDIGCGDGYFLRRSKCKERIGLDKLLGDDIKDRLDIHYIRLTGNGGDPWQSLQCMFNKKHSQALEQLEKGQTVTVQGRYSGSVIAIRMVDCVLVF